MCSGQWEKSKHHTNRGLNGNRTLGCALSLAPQTQARLLKMCGPAESQYQLPETWARPRGSSQLTSDAWMRPKHTEQEKAFPARQHNDLLINGGLEVFCYVAKANWQEYFSSNEVILSYSSGWLFMWFISLIHFHPFIPIFGTYTLKNKVKSYVNLAPPWITCTDMDGPRDCHAECHTERKTNVTH